MQFMARCFGCWQMMWPCQACDDNARECKLQKIANGFEATPGTVQMDGKYFAVVTYPDGSKGAWKWDANRYEWRAVESVASTPCDVSARDSL